MGENVKILGEIKEPDQYIVDDSMIIPPLSGEEAKKVEIVRGQVPSGAGSSDPVSLCTDQLKGA